MIKLQSIILCIIFIFPQIIAHKSVKCDRSCPGGPFKLVSFPFGFSSGCDIQLNCTSNGTVFIDEFSVQKVTSDGILLVNLPAKCGRSLEILHHLYGQNYAPTSHNAILLENCTSPVGTCMIPTTMVKTHLEILDCGYKDNNSVSCYSPSKSNMFIDYENLTRTGCRSLFSAISSEYFGNNNSAVSLDVQLVQLGWWLGGHCQCSDDATCTQIVSPVDGGRGYRCQCVDGFVGDGYKSSMGCRKASSSCHIRKYLSGNCGGKTRVGVLVGGVVVGASLIVSIGLICCFIRRRSVLKTRNSTNRHLWRATGITIPIYHYKEIEKATNSFADKQRLGTGAYGTVYSGKLHNDQWVAIKRIKHRSDTDSIEQAMNEIKLLSSVNHPNLVRLLGCSIDKDEQILVYEFMPYGTLSQHLQRERGNGLAWPVRLTIATETAQAIAYLHSAMNPPIYHRDVKSSNILLDYNYKTKVADFGLSRLGIIESSHISTAPQGTPGYLDPEYHQNFHLSNKSDVYSFGVVLVEIITALRAVDFSRRQNEVNLAYLAIDRIGKGCLDEIIDPLILETNKDDVWTISSLHKVAELAFRCLAFHSDMRPSMTEVAAELEQITASRWASSEESKKGCLSEESNSSSSSSSSIVSENKPENLMVKKNELGKGELFGSVNSVEGRDFSTNSVQDPSPSDSSSPSSNSLLGHVVQ